MKRFMILSAATLGAFQAHAADLPAPIIAPVPFTWTGFYIGANVGALIDDSRVVSVPTGSLIPPSVIAITGIQQFSRTTRFDETSVAGGGQIGANYQFGPGGVPFLPGGSLVVGVEADIQGTGARQSRSFLDVGVVPPGVANLSTTVRQRIDYFGTARARLGFAVDRVFVYATGGFAYGEVRNSLNYTFGGPFFAGAQFAGARTTFHTGYTVGGGIEYALPTNSFLNIFRSSAITLKAEYLYVGLGDKSGVAVRTAAGGTSVPTDTFTYRGSPDFHVARVGINVKF